MFLYRLWCFLEATNKLNKIQSHSIRRNNSVVCSDRSPKNLYTIDMKMSELLKKVVTCFVGLFAIQLFLKRKSKKAPGTFWQNVHYQINAKNAFSFGLLFGFISVSSSLCHKNDAQLYHKQYRCFYTFFPSAKRTVPHYHVLSSSISNFLWSSHFVHSFRSWYLNRRFGTLFFSC